jgi:hypothetical protein
LQSWALPYVCGWGLSCALATGLVLRTPKAFVFTQRGYASFLLVPWRLTTFLVATAFFFLAAPYTGDPYWDHVVGGMMPLFTYLSAPWAVGALYRARRERAPLRQAYVALVAWLFSASWCYDGYLLARDREYPRTWLANLLASSMLYLFAGLFWNVTYRAEVGVTFAFTRPDWLAPTRVRGRALAWLVGAALLLAGIVVVAMWPFLVEVYDQARPAGAR